MYFNSNPAPTSPHQELSSLSHRPAYNTEHGHVPTLECFSRICLKQRRRRSKLMYHKGKLHFHLYSIKCGFSEVLPYLTSSFLTAWHSLVDYRNDSLYQSSYSPLSFQGNQYDLSRFIFDLPLSVSTLESLTWHFFKPKQAVEWYYTCIVVWNTTVLSGTIQY